MKLIDCVWNRLMIAYKKAKIGKNVKIYGRIYIHGRKGGLVIGDNCTLMSSENANPTSGMNHIHLVVGDGGKLVIGDNVGISHANITAYEKVIIEDNVLIGSGVKIWDTDFHPINYKDRVELGHGGKTKPIIIKEGAFIGGCSIVLKGANVGIRSVIGAGSVVTGIIPDGEVWGGSPARFIRRVEEN